MFEVSNIEILNLNCGFVICHLNFIHCVLSTKPARLAYLRHTASIYPEP